MTRLPLLILKGRIPLTHTYATTDVVLDTDTGEVWAQDFAHFTGLMARDHPRWPSVANLLDGEHVRLFNSMTDLTMWCLERKVVVGKCHTVRTTHERAPVEETLKVLNRALDRIPLVVDPVPMDAETFLNRVGALHLGQHPMGEANAALDEAAPIGGLELTGAWVAADHLALTRERLLAVFKKSDVMLGHDDHAADLGRHAHDVLADRVIKALGLDEPPFGHKIYEPGAPASLFETENDEVVAKTVYFARDKFASAVELARGHGLKIGIGCDARCEHDDTGKPKIGLYITREF